MKNRAAILARVSTSDQSVDRQISELTIYADSKQLEIVEVLTETISGAKKNSERAAIQKLITLAESKKINKVLVHEVSRLGRDTAQVLETLEKLHKLNVSVVVLNYQLETLNADGTQNSMAQFLLTILADIGRMERLTLIERINSGLAEAKRKGKVLGRPEGYKKDLLKEHSKVAKHLKEGRSIAETAAICGVGKSTVQRVRAALKE